MSKGKNVKFISVGFIAGAVFFSGVSYAANNATQLKAFFGVKLIQNGIDKTPEDKKPFIVDGTTYVPLRTASELTGVDIAWDGKNSAVIIGKKVEGVALPVPSNVVATTNAVTFSFAQNQKMIINNKTYGNKGQVLVADFQDNFYRGETATFSYDLNAQYATLTFGIGMDDESFNGPTRTLTFKDQDGVLVKQVTVGMGSVQEGIELNVRGIVRLDIEISNLESGLSIIDIINPVLKR
ncbi:stalk domain-containing protein [Paenibacillus silvisoli]|uniref:stalk domain-containing protein n=1 Tax=Paenibacillus silvisoli TaxID=3110539 RepID=UPI0028055AA2|nr:stalk domain-containing protein [Paenibacillus silvisoli]